LYNIAQLVVLILFWPVLLLLVAAKAKYRHLLRRRLGLRLPQIPPSPDRKKLNFWVHALSVGEVTSAAPLIHGLRRQYPDSRIIVTASTITGETVGKTILNKQADLIFSSPLDLLPVVRRYIRHIRPDIYILVETDFWPNLLAEMSRNHIPTLLVNGRISQKSIQTYKKFSWFFLPMFSRFSSICLQTREEKEKFLKLGVDQDRLHTLGNLKYDLPDQAATAPCGRTFQLPPQRLLFIAGSTHPGEEECIFTAYQQVRRTHPELFLILVPRKPERAEEILEIGQHLDLYGVRRTTPSASTLDYLLVDTIGELTQLYAHCHIAFTGGSLVAAGGHNPLEPARMALPVLFGPHMEDFQEISTELITWGGARTVANCNELSAMLTELVENGSFRQEMGTKAYEAVSARQGVVDRHLDMIETLL